MIIRKRKPKKEKNSGIYRVKHEIHFFLLQTNFFYYRFAQKEKET